MQIEFVGERLVEVSKDQTILDASLQAGIPHYHACGGRGKCSTCRVLVLGGNRNLTPENEIELHLRKSFDIPSTVRLACQTRVNGDNVQVERIIKDDADFDLNFKRNNLDSTKLVSKPMGSERQLVLFFLDVRNFTVFVENNLAFDVVYLTRKLFTFISRIIEAHDGCIIETTGDQIYAAFGFDTDVKSASSSAVSCGIKILSELESLNKNYLQKYFYESFAIGIGIHSGNVIVGELQVGEQRKRIVMGLAVNIASRLQDCTKELNNSFIVSREVMKWLHQYKDLKKREVFLKGVSSPIDVYLMGKPYIG